MSSIINQSPFLRTARKFPEDLHMLALEVDKTYIDIANAVNNRTIGLFPTTRPAINGESWFLTKNQRQQGFRQVYLFEATGNVPHGIPFDDVSYFTNCFGSYTDGTNWYGVIFGSNVAIAGQVSFYITPTTSSASGNIVILSGAGAPTIDYGLIVLQWITNP